MAQNKMIFSFIMVLVIEACLWFFAGQTLEKSALFGFVFNIGSVTLSATTLFYGILIVALGVFTAAQIIPGNFLSISPYAVFAGVSIVVMTYVASLVRLAAFAGGQLESYDPDGTIRAMFYVFVIGPLALLYMMAVFEFARSNT